MSRDEPCRFSLCRGDLRWVLGGLVGLALGLCGCGGDPDVLTRTAAEHGAILFDSPELSESSSNVLSCGTCHDVAGFAEPGSYRADGSSLAIGAPLGGAVRRPSFWGGSERSLLRSINHCRRFFMRSDVVWDGSEPEAEALYAFLESNIATGSGHAQPFTLGAVADPGLGDGARGRLEYDALCAACHGQKSTGFGALVTTSPILPEEVLASHPSPEYTDADRRLVFVEKTRHGVFLGYGGSMPPYSLEVLSDDGLADLMTYLEVP